MNDDSKPRQNGKEREVAATTSSSQTGADGDVEMAI